MGRFLITCMTALCLVGVPSPAALADDGADSAGQEFAGQIHQMDKSARRDVALGELVAEELGQVLGIALSPALGLAAVGFWHHYISDRPVKRWYTSPWFIWIMATLAMLVAAKDTLGTVFGPAKQVADAAEVLLNKATGSLGLVVTAGYAMDAFGAPMDMLANQMWDWVAPAALAAGAEAAAPVPAGGLSVGGVLASALGSIAYMAVWLTSQTFNVFVMLNQFSPLDPFLKGARLTLVLAIGGACYLSPWVGVPICILYIGISLALVGFCSRVLVFGSVMAWDLLTLKKGAEVDPEGGVVAFAGGGLEGVPARSPGRLYRLPDGGVVFRYRAWLFLRRKEVAFEPAGLYAIDGALYPSLNANDDNKGPATLLLAPRYREAAEAVSSAFSLAGTGDTWLERAMDSAEGFFARRWAQMKALPATFMQ
ncbi:MAG: hypothetical protein VYE15_03055 [Myxococcota bacterium]|nr:hypothetical protein [Myxococcota bacterium]